MPGSVTRMARFDALPREVRKAIANTPMGVEAAVDKAYAMQGKPTKAILKAIANIAEKRVDALPAEKHVAEAFLKELGL